MPAEKCKPRTTTAPYNRQPRKPKPKDTPSTSALGVASAPQQNLTLSDWLTVFACIDTHPLTSQADVVTHFKTQKSGASIFTQPMLCQKLKEHPQLEKCVNENPFSLIIKMAMDCYMTRCREGPVLMGNAHGGERGTS
ncbi:hypothetical protein PAXRUDRAFT_147782 [Paxillus rubicundulus Ve08.2h10]|uniref:Uncharacterized protein n=1 Tax=Paxillus rubicundulus Ve08.2h10 TaxID=930991 RepID=A0A0D0DTX3_9AGAM|nr:hypothetical protein PAXRUDRAFT_147782 [Paxillus rubicundulus Ve08.2h10]